MEEIGRKDITLAQKKAAKRAIRLNKALGFFYYTVEKGGLYKVMPDGKRSFVRAPKFGLVRVENKRLKIKV